jgi:inosose dehydratase
MSTAPNKIAGPPISWGVCEVPGWGYQLPPDRVLTEMREIGLAATELGPEGFLPTEPKRWPTCCPDTGCTRSAGSPRCCSTAPITTRCGT